MFISFEGTEGVGKSTLIQRVHHYFTSQGQDVILTREPGGTSLAEKIRQLLLTQSTEKMCADTELLLMYAARSQHLNQVILPALAQGKVVLTDRFTDASFAYQVMGRGLCHEKLQQLNDTFVSQMPNLTFWLDAPIEVGMARAEARGMLDRFEQEKLTFFSKVRAGYALLHEQSPERVKRLDATQSPDEVFEAAIACLNELSLK